MRILNLPIPIFAAALVPQIEPPNMSALPAWVAAVAAWIFVLGWFLQQYSKLPGANGERRAGGFGEDDRKQAAGVAAQVEAIHRTVSREDPEKPGYKMVWHSGKEAREMRETIARLAGLADVWVQDREDWRRDREEWRQDREEWRQDRARMETRITNLEEVNRRQEHALDRIGGGA